MHQMQYLTTFYVWIFLCGLSITMIARGQPDEILTCPESSAECSKDEVTRTETDSTSTRQALGRAQEDRDFFDAAYMQRKQEEFIQRESVIMYLEELESRHVVEQARKIKTLQEESARLTKEQGRLKKVSLVSSVGYESPKVDIDVVAEEQLLAMQAEVDAIAQAYSQAESEMLYQRTLETI
jgi:hypothetical protein